MNCVLKVTALAMAAFAGFACAAQPTGEAVELARAGVVFNDPTRNPGDGVFSEEDHAFLDELTRRGVQFFLDEADPVSGLMPDRSRAAGGPSNGVSSTASVGFGITALTIAESRGWISRDEAYERILRVLKFLRDDVEHVRGHFYHFIDMRTGERVWNCEVSNIDTALLMAGVITVRQHFPDTELAQIADELYRRVEWDWLLDENKHLHMGWTPENGLIPARWNHYNEGPLLILLALGSPTHPIPKEAWDAWYRKPVMNYAGLEWVQCPPLFTHQYKHCWFDLRGLADDYMDFFRNAQLATIAMRQWSIDELSQSWPQYGPDYWGLTASDGKTGYSVWGGPPADGPIDGSVVSAAAAGSLAFEPRICVDVLKALKANHGERAWTKYGFVDAFNPADDWYNQDVIGIDIGPTVLMAENARTGFVWKTFMSAPEARRALEIAGFRPSHGRTKTDPTTSLTGPVGAQGEAVPVR